MDAPVFSSRKRKGHLASQVSRINKPAAMRIPGLGDRAECAAGHSHAQPPVTMDRSALPVHLVKEALGHAGVLPAGTTFTRDRRMALVCTQSHRAVCVIGSEAQRNGEAATNHAHMRLLHWNAQLSRCSVIAKSLRSIGLGGVSPALENGQALRSFRLPDFQLAVGANLCQQPPNQLISGTSAVL